jgi:outer membrane lipoprotein-sorting protein
MRPFRLLLLGFVATVLAFSPGCLFRTRTVQVQQTKGPVLTATLNELVNRINSDAAKVQSLNASVNIDSSVGGEKKGQITDYQQISGYVLLRRPSMIRMIGLFPLVRNKAFDMVSDGNEFKLWIPVKNKFYVGHNDVVKPGASSLESLRPQVIYDALLLHRIDPEKDVAVLESNTVMVVDEKTKHVIEIPKYVVDVVTKDNEGKYYLERKVLFERSNLVADEQIFYDKAGNVATEADYQVFKDFNGISFPTVINIKRPQEEYDITLGVTKLTLNEPLKDDQFALDQPPGSQLINLDQQNLNAATGNSSAGSAKQSAHLHR